MNTPRVDVDDADRLTRVKLSSAMEPGDLRVTGLVSELGAGKVLDYLEAAAEVENHWGFAIGQQLAQVDPAKALEQAAARGIRFIIPGDAEWPDRLAGLRGAGALHERGGEPVGLWIGGAADLNQLAANAVAVVGSRAATSYGTEQATELSRDLAAMGHTVVSGLAYGVDQAAHRGALVAGGPTIAVMPCGADRPYPAAHEASKRTRELLPHQDAKGDEWRLVDHIEEVRDGAHPEWEAAVEQILHISAKVEDLLTSKAGLFENLPAPESYGQFLAHSGRLRMYWEQRQNQPPDKRLAFAGDQMDEDIAAEHAAIKKRLQNLGVKRSS